MTAKEPGHPAAGRAEAPSDRAARRRARQAEALRANLRRRKAQARARTGGEGGDGPPDGNDAPGAGR